MPPTVQDALDAVTAAKARVDSSVADLNSTIADLQTQLGAVPPTVDLQPIIDAANAIDPSSATTVGDLTGSNSAAVPNPFDDSVSPSI